MNGDWLAPPAKHVSALGKIGLLGHRGHIQTEFTSLLLYETEKEHSCRIATVFYTDGGS